MHTQFPQMIEKSRLVDSYAAEAVAAGSFYGAAVEVPRGAEDIRFVLEPGTYDRSTGDETYNFYIQGRAKPTDDWVLIPGLSFTQVASATPAGEILPTAANAPGVVIPRWVRAMLTSAGTTPIATCKIKMLYRMAPTGCGTQYESGEIGG